MEKVEVRSLSGNEVLGRHIISSSGAELISAGTKLKKEYVDRLLELGIDFVYINTAVESLEFDSVKTDNIGNNSNNHQSVMTNSEYKEFSDKIETNLKLKEHERQKRETYIATKEKVKNIIESHIYKYSAQLVPICKIAEAIIDEAINDENISEKLIDIKNDSFDMYTHSVNVCVYSTILATRMGMSKESIEDIARGALLHDIGLRYILVPYENYDIEEESPRQKVEYRKHVVYGYDAIKEVSWLSETSKEIILNHHERIDNSGFPFKVNSDKLKKEVKIVAVADAFDRLVCGIGCKREKLHNVVQYLKLNSGVSLEKNIVEQLLSLIAIYPTDSKVELSTGEVGLVIFQNKGFPDRPSLKILKDKLGNIPTKETFLDLMKELSIVVVKIVQ